MDIEAFDRLYPSPAHAAAAERKARHDLVVAEHPDRRLGKDRSGVVIVAAALAASLIGGIAYVSQPADRQLPAPAAPSHTAAIPVQAQVPVIQHPRIVTVAIDRVSPPPRRKSAAQVTAVAEAPKHPPTKTPSSRWIKDPLSGDALAAALVIDKKRTIALNAEQLRLTAKTLPVIPPSATTIVQPDAL